MSVFQHGDSGLEVRSLMCPRVGTNRVDLRQSPPVENASVTPGTTSDKYFRCAAATVEKGRVGLD